MRRDFYRNVKGVMFGVDTEGVTPQKLQIRATEDAMGKTLSVSSDELGVMISVDAEELFRWVRASK